MPLSLPAEARATTVRNAVVNMRGIGFFSGRELSETRATEVVTGLEAQAFAAASSVAEYAKKLSELTLAHVGSVQQSAPAAASPATAPHAAATSPDFVLGSSETVWEQESITPILDLEAGLLKGDGANLQACSARMEATLAALEAADPEASPLREAQELEDGGIRTLLNQLPKLTPDELKRIINADTKRTFQGDLAKSVLEPVLQQAAELFDGEYHQGEARVAGFLLMMLPADQVVRTLHLLQRSPRHGVFAYWRNLAVGLAADANCVEAILAKTDPELAAHLATKLFLPAGTWCPKYCAALGVSMLPYLNLITFFERFVAEGADFLVRFCLALLQEVRPALMAAGDISQGLRQLEIKQHVGQDGAGLQTTIALVERVIARTDTLKELQLDKTLTRYREEFLATEVKKGIERYVNPANEDEEGVEECQLCNDNLPDFRCKDCGLVVCEECHAEPPEGSKHSSDHSVEEFE